MRDKSVIIRIVVVVLCLSASQAMAVVDFNDGQIHDIDYEINDNVWVDYHVPGAQTTVNLLDGGAITSPYDLLAYEDSIINISGGLIGGGLGASGRSQVDISDGSMGGSLSASGSSQVTFSGGSIGGELSAYGSSQVAISGGSIGDSLWALGSSRVAISGGSIDRRLYVSYNSQVTLSGGSISTDLWPYGYGILTIRGSDFAVDGTPFGYGELASILGGNPGSEPHRYLTGTLASGELLHNGFYIGDAAKIVLVPEPAALLLLGLGGLFLRCRRPIF